MIHTISGLMSGGKTLYASILTYNDFLSGNVIYSNINLNFPHYFINNDYLIYLALNNKDISNCTFLLDEFWLFLDSRRSTSHINVCSNWFFLQSSKGNNIKIYITAQTQGQLDIRLRNNQHIVSFCQRKFLYKGQLLEIPDKYKSIRKFDKISKELENMLVIEVKTFSQTMEGDYKLTKIEVLQPQEYYKLYNTEERVINTAQADKIFNMNNEGLNNYINDNGEAEL